MTNYIWITTQFEGVHKYPDAPDDVSFLRNEHRHIFHVKVWIEILKNLNRELEFFMVKKKIDAYITENYSYKTFTKSCEMIANDILQFSCSCWPNREIHVTVSEDNENGGGSTYVPKK
jgi:hypothetical protein